MENLLQHGRELIQREPLKSSQLQFYAAELLPKLTEQQILEAVKHYSLDNHWPSINEILAFNQQATSNDRALAEKLVQRAIGLLRYPQNGGHAQAAQTDPEAYALLSLVGRWFDVHMRAETPRGLVDLRFELKTLAMDALKTSKAGHSSLQAARDTQTFIDDPKTQPRRCLTPFQKD